MRLGLMAAALILPLAGCVVQPSGSAGYGYQASSYTAAGSSYPGAYPGAYEGTYPGDYQAADSGYSGYNYNDGAPSMIVQGASVPLLFYGGGWGYWDGSRRWHRAPQYVYRHLEERHPGGYGFRGGGQGYYGRSAGPGYGGVISRPDFRQYGGVPPGARYGGPGPGYQGNRFGGAAPFQPNPGPMHNATAPFQPNPGPMHNAAAPQPRFVPQAQAARPAPAAPPPAAQAPRGGRCIAPFQHC